MIFNIYCNYLFFEEHKNLPQGYFKKKSKKMGRTLHRFYILNENKLFYMKNEKSK